MHTIKLDYQEVRLVLQSLAHRQLQTDNPALKAKLKAAEDNISNQVLGK